MKLFIFALLLALFVAAFANPTTDSVKATDSSPSVETVPAVVDTPAAGL